MAENVQINYFYCVNEHIKLSRVTNMCCTTLMTKRSHCHWKHNFFSLFLKTPLSPTLIKWQQDFFSLRHRFPCHPPWLCLGQSRGVFRKVKDWAIDLVCVQKRCQRPLRLFYIHMSISEVGQRTLHQRGNYMGVCGAECNIFMKLLEPICDLKSFANINLALYCSQMKRTKAAMHAWDQLSLTYKGDSTTFTRRLWLIGHTIQHVKTTVDVERDGNKSQLLLPVALKLMSLKMKATPRGLVLWIL